MSNDNRFATNNEGCDSFEEVERACSGKETLLPNDSALVDGLYVEIETGEKEIETELGHHRFENKPRDELKARLSEQNPLDVIINEEFGI